MSKAWVERKRLVEYCDDLLQSRRFSDYCPNGLQVEGSQKIGRLVTGVTACQALLDEAVAWQADALLVHHGYFWKGEASAITGIKRQRLATLLTHEINLIAYHLPLDAHAVYGNNARLGKRLGLEVSDSLEPGNPLAIGHLGLLSPSLSLSEFSQRVRLALGREPQVIKGGEHPVRKVAWCTGAAERYIEQAYELGADTYISGEISEPVVHFAREAGIHYIGAGHHATERYGVQALGEHLARHFGLEHRFIDIDNPV
ncbi:Nif3-like dinuclear metal center hexameric protein [Nitrincola tapanii]|uniref:Nif3-like dinuclear metal center hexameric protein n=1 Tax=Nitrincola tapanii TaxID=1708751 RepID=A0A5A9W0I5_9GAMM|nr:Nif3-like dinuclear metal center hexameric protein [Nitrincola tapanii]KAA0874072.1 Nif3-like dinuclear metal center hexameric protein [Nitrincola tapanii]